MSTPDLISLKASCAQLIAQLDILNLKPGIDQEQLSALKEIGNQAIDQFAELIKMAERRSTLEKKGKNLASRCQTLLTNLSTKASLTSLADLLAAPSESLLLEKAKEVDQLNNEYRQIQAEQIAVAVERRRIAEAALKSQAEALAKVVKIETSLKALLHRR